MWVKLWVKTTMFLTAVNLADIRISMFKSANADILVHLYTDIHGKHIQTAQIGSTRGFNKVSGKIQVTPHPVLQS